MGSQIFIPKLHCDWSRHFRLEWNWENAQAVGNTGHLSKMSNWIDFVGRNATTFNSAPPNRLQWIAQHAIYIIMSVEYVPGVVGWHCLRTFLRCGRHVCLLSAGLLIAWIFKWNSSSVEVKIKEIKFIFAPFSCSLFSIMGTKHLLHVRRATI